MIISHRHKFIFFKTEKTAGTSLEIALSKFCGPEDIITPISPKDEKTRKEMGFQTARNYRKPLRHWTAKELARYVIYGDPNHTFYNHIPGREIKRKIPAEVWENYVKFTIVRNPWDRMVSLYHWKNGQAGGNRFKDFHDFLLRHPDATLSNWFYYTENGQVLADRIIRYENLRQDLRDLSRVLGLDENIYSVMSRIHAKGEYRSQGDKEDELKTMGEFERRLIGMLAYKEIEYFGYAFEQSAGTGVDKAQPGNRGHNAPSVPAEVYELES